MSDIVVVMVERTSSRASDKEAPLQGFGPNNKGNQYMNMENQTRCCCWQ